MSILLYPRFSLKCGIPNQIFICGQILGRCQQENAMGSMLSLQRAAGNRTGRMAQKVWLKGNWGEKSRREGGRESKWEKAATKVV